MQSLAEIKDHLSGQPNPDDQLAYITTSTIIMYFGLDGNPSCVAVSIQLECNP